MIRHFPTPHPDELLYSVCARFQDRVQYRNKMSVGHELFGNKRASATVDLPCYLDYLCRALPSGHSWTVNRFIEEHTLFPFFRPFITFEQGKCVRDNMAGGNSLTAKLVSGSAASGIRMPDWLRFCPQCAKDDKRYFHEPFWHRLHQVPSVEVCAAHLVFLENSNARIRNRDTIYDYVSAERAMSSVEVRLLDTSNAMHQVLVKVAQDVEWLLDSHRSDSNLTLLYQSHVLLLFERGLASFNGRVWGYKLVQALEDYYSCDLLQHLNCDIDKNNLSNWPSVFMKDLKRGKSHHPLQHLLLIQMLGQTAESFFGCPVTYKPFGEGP
jgi:hypothetical protein